MATPGIAIQKPHAPSLARRTSERSAPQPRAPITPTSTWSVSVSSQPHPAHMDTCAAVLHCRAVRTRGTGTQQLGRSIGKLHRPDPHALRMEGRGACFSPSSTLCGRRAAGQRQRACSLLSARPSRPASDNPDLGAGTRWKQENRNKKNSEGRCLAHVSWSWAAGQSHRDMASLTRRRGGGMKPSTDLRAPSPAGSLTIVFRQTIRNQGVGDPETRHCGLSIKPASGCSGGGSRRAVSLCIPTTHIVPPDPFALSRSTACILANETTQMR